jgi:hypothetical protein
VFWIILTSYQGRADKIISTVQVDPVSCTGDNALSAKTEKQHCRRVKRFTFQKLASALDEIDRETVIPLSSAKTREKNDAEILFDSVKSLHEKGEGGILYDSVKSMMLCDSVQSIHPWGSTLFISSGGQHGTAVGSANILWISQSKCLAPSAVQTSAASVATTGKTSALFPAACRTSAAFAAPDFSASPTSAVSVSTAGPTSVAVSAVAIVAIAYCCCCC